jgi:hypothetical protein
VPPASKKFIHHVVLINTVGNTTYLDDSLISGSLDVAFSVQNWNPVVYNNHLMGVLYEVDRHPPPASRRPV